MEKLALPPGKETVMPTYKTLRFGSLQYQEEDVILLPDGLIGMPQLSRWLVLELGDDMPMKWFQSLERGDFGFPVTQPYFFMDDYEVPLSEANREAMANQTAEDLVTMIITTVHEDGASMTGNLMAPLMIDSRSRRGLQLTLDAQKYGTRQEINYFKFGLAVQTESSDNASPAAGEQQAEAGSPADERETVDV